MTRTCRFSLCRVRRITLFTLYFASIEFVVLLYSFNILSSILEEGYVSVALYGPYARLSVSVIKSSIVER